jgi:hypothetical protein
MCLIKGAFVGEKNFDIFLDLRVNSYIHIYLCICTYLYISLISLGRRHSCQALLSVFFFIFADVNHMRNCEIIMYFAVVIVDMHRT